MKTFITLDEKHRLTRISRWITIKTSYKVNKNNRLYDFVMDGNRYHPDDKKYNPNNGVFLDYFIFNGRTYAIDQFISLGSICIGEKPYTFIDTDNKIHAVHAVDFYGSLYNPLYIEIDEYGEKVRIYEV